MDRGGGGVGAVKPDYRPAYFATVDGVIKRMVAKDEMDVVRFNVARQTGVMYPRSLVRSMAGVRH